MCLNHGRPILCSADDESIKLGRLFLEHPLATKEDSRCLVLCEVLAMRQPLFRAMIGGVQGEELDRLVSEVMQRLPEWENYWLDYYCGCRKRNTYTLTLQPG